MSKKQQTTDKKPQNGNRSGQSQEQQPSKQQTRC